MSYETSDMACVSFRELRNVVILSMLIVSCKNFNTRWPLRSELV